jgi:M6 family metalloprotease-like protein
MKAKNPFAKSSCSREAALTCGIGILLSVLLPSSIQAVTVDAFGYGSMRVNNRAALGTRPLLVIVAKYAGNPELATENWDELIFGNGTSLNRYYQEVSNGGFSWSRGGLVEVNFTEPERATITRREQIIQEMVSRTGFDCAIFDVNDDGTVAGDELGILIIGNRNDSDGQAGHVRVTVLSQSSLLVTLDLGACAGGHRESLMTFCHELCHTLGAVDLYGNNERLHSSISLMGGTLAANSNRDTFHLDPWHKMQLGWSEPRIVSLRSSDSAIIPAAQLKRPDGPVLLFDPVRGTQEFYILEYRTNRTSLGAGFDASVAQHGLLIWHIRQQVDHRPVQGAPHTTLPFQTQTGWTFCKKCNGNYYRPNQSLSRCPDSGTHEPFDDHDFSMVWDTPDPNDPTDPGQHNWRWCRKCQGMFFGGNSAPTRCPADNSSHDGSQSYNYVLRLQSQKMNLGQRGWRWCNKCQALFYSGLDNNGNLIAAAGVCPASGQHDSQGSDEYNMHYEVHDVFNEAAGSGATRIVLGGTTSWTTDNITPYSRWFSDASEVRVRFRPMEYLNGGDALLVQWFSELPPPSFSGDTWVDYAWFPFPLNDGSFSLPFTSLADAVNRSPFYSRILIKPGFGAEAIRITQSVFLDAPLGPVTIGRSGP